MQNQVHSIYFLNPKLQASNHLHWLYSPVSGLVGNPEDRFSLDAANIKGYGVIRKAFIRRDFRIDNYFISKTL